MDGWHRCLLYQPNVSQRPELLKYWKLAYNVDWAREEGGSLRSDSLEVWGAGGKAWLKASEDLIAFSACHDK